MLYSNFIETGVISKNPVRFTNSRGYEFSIFGFGYDNGNHITVLMWGWKNLRVGDKITITGELRENWRYRVLRLYCEIEDVVKIAPDNV